VPGDWRCVKEVGGGMLLDWGVHLIDQIMYMVKSPVAEVYAHLLSVKFKDVDDNFKVLLRALRKRLVRTRRGRYLYVYKPPALARFRRRRHDAG
jgi:predicted dehydrogenase